MKKPTTLDFTDGPIFRKILLFAIPMMLNSLVQNLYSTADTVMVGQFVGNGAMAAVGASAQPLALLVNLFAGLALGVTVVCGNLKGARKHKELSECMQSSVLLGAAVGAIISLLGIPLKNARREVKGAVNLFGTLKKDFGGRKTTWGSLGDVLQADIQDTIPVWGWLIFGFVWGVSAVAVVFTAIDLKKYAKLSMVCYIGLGWCVVLALKPTIASVPMSGLLWLLAGGIAYTVGAVLYGLGKKKRYMHSIFHLFVLLGSILQFVAIIGYVL
jgi:hypothetical protein